MNSRAARIGPARSSEAAIGRDLAEAGRPLLDAVGGAQARLDLVERVSRRRCADGHQLGRQAGLLWAMLAERCARAEAEGRDVAQAIGPVIRLMEGRVKQAGLPLPGARNGPRRRGPHRG